MSTPSQLRTFILGIGRKEQGIPPPELGVLERQEEPLVVMSMERVATPKSDVPPPRAEPLVLCARCGKMYNPGENKDGACRWHTTPATVAAAKRATGATRAELVGVPMNTIRNPVALYPLFSSGTAFYGSAPVAIHVCCGRKVDGRENGCWVGRHSFDNPLPDPSDIANNQYPTAWEPCCLTGREAVARLRKYASEERWENAFMEEYLINSALSIENDPCAVPRTPPRFKEPKFGLVADADVYDGGLCTSSYTSPISEKIRQRIEQCSRVCWERAAALKRGAPLPSPPPRVVIEPTAPPLPSPSESVDNIIDQIDRGIIGAIEDISGAYESKKKDVELNETIDEIMQKYANINLDGWPTNFEDVKTKLKQDGLAGVKIDIVTPENVAEDVKRALTTAASTEIRAANEALNKKRAQIRRAVVELLQEASDIMKQSFPEIPKDQISPSAWFSPQTQQTIETYNEAIKKFNAAKEAVPSTAMFSPETPIEQYSINQLEEERTKVLSYTTDLKRTRDIVAYLYKQLYDLTMMPSKREYWLPEGSVVK